MTNDPRIHASIWAPVGAVLPADDSRIIRDDHWFQMITPSLKEALLNQVVVSRVATKDAARRVDEAFALYESHRLPFKWSIGPMSTSEVIEPILRKRASDAWPFRGMVVDTALAIAAPEGVTVETVERANYADFLDVYCAGWNLEPHRAFETKRLSQALSPTSTTQFFLARHHGRPAAIAGSVVTDSYGYLISAVVVPELRGKGAYRALLRHRLIDLQARGRPFAVTQAREKTSAPILEAIGFTTTFRGTIYRF